MAPSVSVLTGFDCISSNNHPLKLDYQPLFGSSGDEPTLLPRTEGWTPISYPESSGFLVGGATPPKGRYFIYYSRSPSFVALLIIPLVYRDKPVSEDSGYEIGGKIKF